MIKANELRIGNLIHIEIGTPSLCVHKLAPLDFQDIKSLEERASAIPLIEEWFYKLGFLKIGVNFEKGKVAIYYSHLLGRYVFRYGNKVIIIDEVHQLQNLYFALTGEELNIKID